MQADQRRRILEAIVDAVAERGYAATTLADVVGRARVSRETFYEMFSDKESCFVAAYAAYRTRLREAAVASAAADPTGTARERHTRNLRRYLESLAAVPKETRCMVLEQPVGNPELAAAQTRLHEAGVAHLMELYATEDRFACRAYSAMVHHLVVEEVRAGRTERLPELAEPIMRLVGTYIAGAATPAGG